MKMDTCETCKNYRTDEWGNNGFCDEIREKVNEHMWCEECEKYEEED